MLGPAAQASLTSDHTSNSIDGLDSMEAYGPSAIGALGPLAHPSSFTLLTDAFGKDMDEMDSEVDAINDPSKINDGAHISGLRSPSKGDLVAHTYVHTPPPPLRLPPESEEDISRRTPNQEEEMDEAPFSEDHNTDPGAISPPIDSDQEEGMDETGFPRDDDTGRNVISPVIGPDEKKEDEMDGDKVNETKREVLINTESHLKSNGKKRTLKEKRKLEWEKKQKEEYEKIVKENHEKKHQGKTKRNKKRRTK